MPDEAVRLGAAAADTINANGTYGQINGLPGQVPYYIFGAGEGVDSNTYQVQCTG